MATRSPNHQVLTQGQYNLLNKRIQEARTNIQSHYPKVPESAAVKRARATIAAYDAKKNELHEKCRLVKADQNYTVLQALEFATDVDGALKAVKAYEAFAARYLQRGLQ